MRIASLGMTALYCYSVITVGTGCIPFFKLGGNVGRGRIKKDSGQSKSPFKPQSMKNGSKTDLSERRVVEEDGPLSDVKKTFDDPAMTSRC